MSELAITFVGTATTILEIAGQRLLTDPVFDPPGASYGAVPGVLERRVKYTRLAGPAIAAADVGRIDAVLLSHDHHGDNLDAAGRALLPQAGAVLTTVAGARRLARDGLTNAIGLVEGAGHRLGDVDVVAAPARHGPPGSQWLAGPVIGFLLRGRGRSLYVSGDTVWHGALARFAQRCKPDVALVHVGAARFGATLGLRYTADAGDLIELARAWPTTTFAPIHYEGWSHFSEGRAALHERLTRAGLASRIVWLEPGRRTQLGA